MTNISSTRRHANVTGGGGAGTGPGFYRQHCSESRGDCYCGCRPVWSPEQITAAVTWSGDNRVNMRRDQPRLIGAGCPTLHPLRTDCLNCGHAALTKDTPPWLMHHLNRRHAAETTNNPPYSRHSARTKHMPPYIRLRRPYFS